MEKERRNKALIYEKEGRNKVFDGRSNIIVLFAPFVLVSLILLWRRFALFCGVLSKYQNKGAYLLSFSLPILIVSFLFCVFLFYRVKKDWNFVFCQFFSMIGLCLPNIVIWNHPLAESIKEVYFYQQAFDEASYLAILTNLLAAVFFVLRVQRGFPSAYRGYLSAVFGGQGKEIQMEKRKMFSQVSMELINLLRQQFFISVILYFFFTFLFSKMGMLRTAMKFYPMLAAAYFVVMFLYAELLFVYYFAEFISAWKACLFFFFLTLFGSVVAGYFNPVFYGAGLWFAAFFASILLYRKLQWLECHMEEEIFCKGSIMETSKKQKPDSKVFSRGPKQKC